MYICNSEAGLDCNECRHAIPHLPEETWINELCTEEGNCTLWDISVKCVTVESE